MSEIERNRLFFTPQERNASLVIINVIYVTCIPFSVLVCGDQQEDKRFSVYIQIKPIALLFSQLMLFIVLLHYLMYFFIPLNE